MSTWEFIKNEIKIYEINKKGYWKFVSLTDILNVIKDEIPKNPTNYIIEIALINSHNKLKIIVPKRDLKEEFALGIFEKYPHAIILDVRFHADSVSFDFVV